MQAVNKKELEKLILDVLRIRDYTNKKLKGRRKFVKLSTNARVAMEKGRQVEDMFNYWQEKFNQAMGIIDELHEKSIQLKDIPGFMTVQKVKPKLSKKNTRITQVHGSMKAKKVLNLLKDIEDKKQEQTKSKEEATKKKEDAKQAFLKCKVQCVCQQAKCMAIGLKQCPVCQHILKSTCSKGKCQVDGKKPIMVLPAAATASSSKRKAPTGVASDSDESTDSEESDSDLCEMEDGSESESSTIDEDLDPTEVLRATWKTLSPPVTEESVMGKWYAVVYNTKRACRLFVGKVIKRFLVDENGPVDSLEVRCLKPRVGSGTLLDDTPEFLPDISLFNLADVIYGPLEVVPMKAGKFDVPEYQQVVEHFDCVKNLERNSLL